MATKQRRGGEEGGLLLVLMVGVAVMFIGVSVAAQAWSATWRRDSEEELIFRANQYVDAILAYRKDHGGHFPVDLEELMKIGPRQVRYIRKLFKDPVNPGGQWGLLYLMPSGNAIYDPVAAQQAAEAPPDDGVGGAAGGAGPAFSGAMRGGVTPIGNLDPMGTGAPQAGGLGALMTPGQGGAPGAALGGRNQQGGVAGGLGGALRGAATAGALRAGGGMAGLGGAGFGGAGGFGGVLPPPKPKGSSFDEDSPSEPPIGWPIVGVISRATGRINDSTFKIYKGHEKVNEWQFHVFDRTIDTAQAPSGTVPGGSPAPFLGPGFGGKGSIGGIGGGAGGNRGGRQQQQKPGGGNQWPPAPPGGN